MITRTRPTTQALLALAVTLCCGAAQAANFSKSVYNGAKDDIKTTYKADRETCSKQTGNAKDICVEQAKGYEKIALARLEYNYTGTPKDELKLNEAVYEARYDVAKEKCDDLSGDAKGLCEREAKTVRDKAKADAKLNKKITDAAIDADDARMKADYKLASAKCDTLAGEPKEVCVASAKARYNER
jgi:hypothetical protein